MKFWHISSHSSENPENIHVLRRGEKKQLQVSIPTTK
jgi:hypothetical protein